MEAIGFSKALINFYETTQHHIPEGSNLHNNHHDNFKPHKFTLGISLKRLLLSQLLDIKFSIHFHSFSLPLLIKVVIRGTKTNKNMFEICKNKVESERGNYDVIVCHS
jgi:hypothetical protein